MITNGLALLCQQVFYTSASRHGQMGEDHRREAFTSEERQQGCSHIAYTKFDTGVLADKQTVQPADQSSFAPRDTLCHFNLSILSDENQGAFNNPWYQGSY